jgi:hypothetical protein
VETYLDVLADFSDDQVRVACNAVMRRNNPFPPSAGELAHECRNAVVHVVDQAKLARFRAHGEPPDKRTPEERAASRARVARMVEEFRASLPQAENEGAGNRSFWRPGPLGALLGGVFAEIAAEEAEKEKGESRIPVR